MILRQLRGETLVHQTNGDQPEGFVTRWWKVPQMVQCCIKSQTTVGRLAESQQSSRGIRTGGRCEQRKLGVLSVDHAFLERFQRVLVLLLQREQDSEVVQRGRRERRRALFSQQRLRLV